MDVRTSYGLSNLHPSTRNVKYKVIALLITTTNNPTLTSRTTPFSCANFNIHEEFTFSTSHLTNKFKSLTSTRTKTWEKVESMPCVLWSSTVLISSTGGSRAEFSYNHTSTKRISSIENYLFTHDQSNNTDISTAIQEFTHPPTNKHNAGITESLPGEFGSTGTHWHQS